MGHGVRNLLSLRWRYETQGKLCSLSIETSVQSGLFVLDRESLRSRWCGRGGVGGGGVGGGGVEGGGVGGGGVGGGVVGGSLTIALRHFHSEICAHER